MMKNVLSKVKSFQLDDDLELALITPLGKPSWIIRKVKSSLNDLSKNSFPVGATFLNYEDGFAAYEQYKGFKSYLGAMPIAQKTTYKSFDSIHCPQYGSDYLIVDICSGQSIAFVDMMDSNTWVELEDASNCIAVPIPSYDSLADSIERHNKKSVEPWGLDV